MVNEINNFLDFYKVFMPSRYRLKMKHPDFDDNLLIKEIQDYGGIDLNNLYFHIFSSKQTKEINFDDFNIGKRLKELITDREKVLFLFDFFISFFTLSPLPFLPKKNLDDIPYYTKEEFNQCFENNLFFGINLKEKLEYLTLNYQKYINVGKMQLFYSFSTKDFYNIFKNSGLLQSFAYQSINNRFEGFYYNKNLIKNINEKKIFIFSDNYISLDCPKDSLIEIKTKNIYGENISSIKFKVNINEIYVPFPLEDSNKNIDFTKKRNIHSRKEVENGEFQTLMFELEIVYDLRKQIHIFMRQKPVPGILDYDSLDKENLSNEYSYFNSLIKKNLLW